VGSVTTLCADVSVPLLITPHSYGVYLVLVLILVVILEVTRKKPKLAAVDDASRDTEMGQPAKTSTMPSYSAPPAPSAPSAEPEFRKEPVQNDP